MKFVSLLPVRDEADIIGQCLEHLLSWSDEIYVFDTGSVDETWEIVQDYAALDRRIVPMRKESVYFSDTRLRGWIFHHARSSLKNGDWFLRVDADEFHHVPPPEFVNTRLRQHETIVYHQYYNFALLQSEVDAWEAGSETLADRSLPIEERRQWYTPSVYAEPRLCRYRETMQWPPTISFPYNAGFVAVERIPIRHYPHRDPVQLERRCRLRALMMRDLENRANWSQPDLHHWTAYDWQTFIVQDDDPKLLHWKPGQALAETHYTNHLACWPYRAAQRVVHAFLLPLLDSRRAPYPDGLNPQEIPEETCQYLKNFLK